MERLSASNASKHMSCHASANLSAAIPGWTPPVEDKTANNAANKGTAMHEVYAGLLNTTTVKELENFSAALAYTAEVRGRRRFTSLIEQTETVDWLVSKPTTTADCVLFTQDEMHVIDLKWGRIPVQVVDNYQLKYYAVTYAKYAPKAKGVTLHIVQPNAGVMEEWFADAATLQQFMADAQAAEAAIMGGDTTFMPGDHCTFCDANPRGRGLKGYPKCPAMMELHYPNAYDEQALLGLED
jgi:hypothetical protein